MSTEQQYLLYEISRRLNSDLNINRVLSDVLYLTLHVVGADNGSIIILDEGGAVAHKILARVNMVPEKAMTVLAEVLSQGLAGWVVERRQGSIVDDVIQDHRWINFPDDEFVGGSAISVPLIRRDRLVGVLTFRHHQTHYFSQEHLDLLSFIAEQSAAAVENARLFHLVQTERAKLEAIINGVGDAIIVVDRQGRILLMNPLARRLVDLAYDAPLQNRLLGEVVSFPALLALWEQYEQGGDVRLEEVPTEDGHIFHAGLTSIDQVGVVIVMHDVTHFKELNKLKDRFVTNVSHDLRLPLQLIYTYTSMLNEIGTLTEQQYEFVQGIDRSAKKMADLLKDLSDLMQFNAGIDMEATPCNMGTIIHQVVERLRPVARDKGLLIENLTPADLPWVLASNRRIDQVLSNLIGNAIKYTLTGRITVNAQADEQRVVVSVQDTGIGIKQEDLKKLFVEFGRLDNDLTSMVEGTGLGLFIAKSIVEQFGGHIWVESIWQQGSKFCFSLPRLRSDSQAAD